MNQHKKGHRILSAIVALAVVVTSMAGLFVHIKLNNVNAADGQFTYTAYATHWGRSDIRAYLNNGLGTVDDDGIVTNKNYYRNSTGRTSAGGSTNYNGGYAEYFNGTEWGLILASTVNTNTYYNNGVGDRNLQSVYETTDRFYLPSGLYLSAGEQIYGKGVISWGADDISDGNIYDEKVVEKGDVHRLIPSAYWSSSQNDNQSFFLRNVGYDGGKAGIYVANGSGSSVGSLEVTSHSNIAPIFRINMGNMFYTGAVKFASSVNLRWINSETINMEKSEDGMYLKINPRQNYEARNFGTYTPRDIEVREADGNTSLAILGGLNDWNQFDGDNFFVVVQAYNENGDNYVAYNELDTSTYHNDQQLIDIADWFNEGGSIDSLIDYTIKVWVERPAGYLATYLSRTTDPVTFKIVANENAGTAGESAVRMEYLETEENIKAASVDITSFATKDELGCSWGDLTELSDEEYTQLLAGTLEYNSSVKEKVGATDQKIHFGTYTDNGNTYTLTSWIAGREDNGVIDSKGETLVLYQAIKDNKNQLSFNSSTSNYLGTTLPDISVVRQAIAGGIGDAGSGMYSYVTDFWEKAITVRVDNTEYTYEEFYNNFYVGDKGGYQYRYNGDRDIWKSDNGWLYDFTKQTDEIGADGGHTVFSTRVYIKEENEIYYSRSNAIGVSKATPDISLTIDGAVPESDTVTFTYGEDTHTAGVNNTEDTDGMPYGEVAYSSDPTGVASIDETTGKITINSVGDFTIKAVIAKTSLYQETTITQAVTVTAKSIEGEANTPADDITVTIDDHDYKEDISYDYVHNGQNFPNKIEIYDGDKLLGVDTDYKVEYKVTDEWISDNSGEALKELTGTITITGQGNYTGTIVKTYRVVDTTPPQVTIRIDGKDNLFQSLLNTFSFGYFYKDTKEITIEVADENESENADQTGSGIASIKYYIDSENKVDLTKGETYQSSQIIANLEKNLSDADWQNYKDDEKPKVGASSDGTKVNGKYVVYAKIEDKAGNITYASSNGIVIYKDTELVDPAIDSKKTYYRTKATSEPINLYLRGNGINTITYKNDDDPNGQLRNVPSNEYVTEEVENSGAGDVISKVTISPTFLNTLSAGSYTFTITYNPLGETYDAQTSTGSEQPASTTVNITVAKRTLTADDFTFKAQEGQAYVEGSNMAPELRVTKNILDSSIVSQPTVTLTYFKDGIGEGMSVPNGVGTYEVRAEITGDDNYEAVSQISNPKWTITLKHADSYATPPEPGEITAIYGQTLKDVKLRDGWAFVENEGQNLDTPVGNVQSNGYSYFTAKYTPTDPSFGFVIADIPVKVNPKDLSNEANITLNQSVYTYNGSRWEPQVEVKYGDLVLQNYDYTVTYPSDMTLIGEKQITITFIGNYTGSKTVTGLIDVDRSTWGEEQVINNIKHYVTSDGTTSVEVNESSKDENGIIWLQESSGGTSAWYGIQYPSGTFMDKSRFYVNWLDQTANRTAWQTAYAQLDEDHKNKVSSGRMRIVQIGVNDPYGNAYTNLDTQISLYVQIGSDWSKDDLNAVYLEQSTDEVINLSFEENKSFVGGRGDFANLTISRFAPYCVYDGAKFNTIDIINNPNTTIGALESGFYVAPDNSDGNDGTLGSLRTVDRIRERQDAQNGNDNVETFIANDNINIKQQSRSSSIAMWIVIIIAILGALLLVIMRMQRRYGVKYYYDMMLYRIKETWETIKNKFKPKSKTQN